MHKKTFSKKIIDWYRIHHRQLPWRETNDPYKIWLSEVILQQTRVVQGLPYYQKFVSKYPTVHSLAKAPEKDVLRLWQGLGYYTRARNLHACAKQIVELYGGSFPEQHDDLLKLKGIGSYTAAAISSMAFNQPTAVVDGNVYRVLSRIFGLDADISSPAGRKMFSSKANELIPIEEPGLFNQAVMEFGALQCVPQSPDCKNCIFINSCFAKNRNLIRELPVKLKKVKVRNRHFTYFIFRFRGKIALKQRNDTDIWKGLYDFPLIEAARNTQLSTLLRERLKGRNGNIRNNPKTIFQTKHVLTHQIIHAQFVLVELLNAELPESFQHEMTKFYTERQIESLPKPVLVSRFLAQISF